jgi:hypothetical protein
MYLLIVHFLPSSCYSRTTEKHLLQGLILFSVVEIY